MVHSVCSKTMSQHQLSLLEHALHLVCRIDPDAWDQIPLDLHPSFARYMPADVWTGRAESRTLVKAALMVIRDAIARTGEFTEETSETAEVVHHR
jgi:hypothetical protein